MNQALNASNKIPPFTADPWSFKVPHLASHRPEYPEKTDTGRKMQNPERKEQGYGNWTLDLPSCEAPAVANRGLTHICPLFVKLRRWRQDKSGWRSHQLIHPLIVDGGTELLRTKWNFLSLDLMCLPEVPRSRATLTSTQWMHQTYRWAHQYTNTLRCQALLEPTQALAKFKWTLSQGLGGEAVNLREMSSGKKIKVESILQINHNYKLEKQKKAND